MIVVAIIGILASIAIPAYQASLAKAKVVDGLQFMSAIKASVASFYAIQGRLPSSFDELGIGTATGTAHGGDTASWEQLYGSSHEVWKAVEYQPKAATDSNGDAVTYYVFVLRSYRNPLWDNTEIGLHFQIKADVDGIVRFRCTINGSYDRARYVPATCRHGRVNQWDW